MTLHLPTYVLEQLEEWRGIIAQHERRSERRRRLNPGQTPPPAEMELDEWGEPVTLAKEQEQRNG